MVDARGNTTTYTYDAAGHETGREDDLGESLIWRYDDIGNRVSQNNRTDAIPSYSVVWTYDPFGRELTRVADGVTTTSTYDLNGNRLTVGDGTLTLTATYDRLNRVLTVDDEDAGGTTDTSYTYSFTSPAWTDVTGTYGGTLDKFDRPTMVNDPASGTDFTWSYGTGGQVLSGVQGNANTVTNTYDKAGRMLTSLVEDAGVDRASYTYTYNRAGQVLSETADVGTDPADGTVSYAYDPLGRLTGSTLSGTTTAYAWDATTNRTSVQVGAGTAATTAYDDANRPTSGANPTATYGSDDDGRLIARPNQTLLWDKLGRLTQVKDAAGTTTLATYTYDPLDRLRTVDYGGGNRIRFRYTGLTTSAAQWIDDVAGTVTRSIGNSWTGEHLLDWTGSNSNRRYYGTNAHHDVTWLATDTGTIIDSLRFDPWGTPRSAVPSGYTPFRFQGSWHDATTDLAWVVTRWYAPALGRFISEDTWLGETRRPDSRHLYVYGEGDPVPRIDPDGRCTRGCVASPDGQERLLQWKAFFKEFPGKERICSGTGACKLVRRSGDGYGVGMISFLKFLVESDRIDESRWWNVSDRSEVQDSLSAWRAVKNGYKISPVGFDPAILWYQYATGDKIHGEYVGGSHRQLWRAHQASLWSGVDQASRFRSAETFREQIVIWKVLNNVQWYYEQRSNFDWSLDLMTIFGGYPVNDYPASKEKACRMAVFDSYAHIVERHFKKPIGIGNYCRDVSRSWPT